MISISLCVLSIIAEMSVSGKTRTDSDEIKHLDSKPPWSGFWRPLPAPRSPEKIKVEFYLATTNTIDKSNREWKVDTTNFFKPSLESLRHLDYQENRTRTVVHINGMYHSMKRNWNLMIRMARAYLLQVDANIIFLQYNAKVWNFYPKLVADARVVGAIAARFLQQLIELTGLEVNKIHIIGFCLGAHVAGYIGKRIPHIHRITGLEPAKLFFETADPKYRLSDSDADHVDVWHTNTNFWGLGCKLPLGDVDFFFNGASVQPGCRSMHRISRVLKQYSRFDFKKAVPNSYLLVASRCSHTRVTDYWIEALESCNCELWGVDRKPWTNKRSSSKTNLIWNQTDHLRSGEKKCVPIGLNTFEHVNFGNFHVTTRKNFPYCDPDNSCNIIS